MCSQCHTCNVYSKFWSDSIIGFYLQRQPLDGLRDGKGVAEAHSQSCFPSSGSNMAARLSRSIDIHSPNADSPSRYLITVFFLSCQYQITLC